jgi:hypothetical protein
MSPAFKERGNLTQIVREMGEGLLSLMGFINGAKFQWSLLTNDKRMNIKSFHSTNLKINLGKSFRQKNNYFY